MTTLRAEWGTEIRRDEHSPFLVYTQRPRSLAALLTHADRWGDRTHVVRDDQRLGFGDLVDASRQVELHLRARGVGAGDRVMLLAFNSVEWIVSFWAAVRAGAVVVLANAWSSAAEVRHSTSLTDPALVLVDASTAGLVGPDRAAAVLDDLVAEARSGPPARDGERSGDSEVAEDDPAVVLFTSGTSGAPKGAVLSHRALIALQHQLLHVTRRLPDSLPEDHPAEVTLQTGPLFHIGGVQALLRSFLLGATLVFPSGRFDPEEVLDLIEREQVHRWGGPPTMLTRVLDSPTIAGRDLRSVRALTLGGAAVAPEVVRRIKTCFPNVERGVGQIYGLTEAGGTLVAASGDDLVRRPGTVGRPLPLAELRIDAPGPDGVGEVLARSPSQMSGYWGRSGDDSTIDAAGWLHTGDLGRIDDDGYVYITGRSKDVVIRGGENIASAHVESALLEHPAVVDACVVGRPDADLGEIVAAAVVVRPDAAETVGELREFVADRLAYFEVPQAWWVRTTALPANAVGKVDKRSLAAAWPGDAPIRDDRSRPGATSNAGRQPQE